MITIYGWSTPGRSWTAARTVRRGESAGVPLFDVLRNHPRNLLLAVWIGLAAFVAQGTLTAFLIAYGVGVGFSRQTVLNGLTLSCSPWSASSVTRRCRTGWGRRPRRARRAVAMTVISVLLFPLVDSGDAVLLVVALAVGQAVIQPAMYGPLAALCAELFSTRSRYTGASLGYRLSGLGTGVAAPRPPRRRRPGAVGREDVHHPGDDADFAIVAAVTDPERGVRQGFTAFLVDRDMGWTSRPPSFRSAWPLTARGPDPWPHRRRRLRARPDRPPGRLVRPAAGAARPPLSAERDSSLDPPSRSSRRLVDLRVLLAGSGRG